MVALFVLVLLVAGVVGWARVRTTNGFRALSVPSPIVGAIIGLGVAQVVITRLPHSFKARHGFQIAMTVSGTITVCMLIAIVVIPAARRGAALVLAGWVMNATAIVANHGMPVEASAARWMDWVPEDDRLSKHVTMSADTHLNFLGDLFRIDLLVERTVISVGDVFLLLGFALAIVDAFSNVPTPQLAEGR